MKIVSKFSKSDLWKIPNILCYIRFLLIPCFIVAYIRAEEPGEYVRAAVIVLLSGITDFLDGFIARRFDMVTELGKIIDPIADKLTQASLIFVLLVKVEGMPQLLTLFAALQLFLVAAGLVMLKKGSKLNGAKWYGKVSTTVFYATMLVLIAVPTLRQEDSNVLMMLCGGFLLLSFLMYIREYVIMYRNLKEGKSNRDRP